MMGHINRIDKYHPSYLVGTENSEKRRFMRKMGRPKVHADAKAAQAAASRAYRARKKAQRLARKDQSQPLKSKYIDLTSVKFW